MDEVIKLNFGKICRLCMCETGEMQSIFSCNLINNLTTILASLTRIELCRDDGLPPNICNTCFEQTNNIQQFKQQCEKSDKLLKEYINIIKLQYNNSDDIKVEPQTNITTDTSMDTDINGFNEFNEFFKPENTIQLNDNYINNSLEKPSANPELIANVNNIAVQVKYLHFCSFCDKSFANTKELTEHVVAYHINELNKNYLSSDSKIEENKLNITQNNDHNETINDNNRDNLFNNINNEPEENKSKINKKKRGRPRKTNNGSDLVCNNNNIHDTVTVAVNEDNLLSDNNEVNSINDKKQQHSCTKCNDCFTKKSDLKRHLITDHNDEDSTVEKKYECIECKKSYGTFDLLIIHMKIHSGNVYNCDLCDKKFSRLDIFYEHKRRHTGERPYLCNKCGKGYFNQIYLDKHLMSHLNDHIEKPEHECNVCGKRLKHLNHLKVHMRTHRDRSKPIQLNSANKKMNLCSVCGRSCSSRSNLAVHMRRHTGQMTNFCKICGKGYPRTTDLTLHMRRHTGEKPFVCHVCNRGFARSDKLAIHMRTHTGEKPYICTICMRAFAQSNDLAHHKKRSICGNNKTIMNETVKQHSDGVSSSIMLPNTSMELSVNRPPPLVAIRPVIDDNQLNLTHNRNISNMNIIGGSYTAMSEQNTILATSTSEVFLNGNRFTSMPVAGTTNPMSVVVATTSTYLR